ncbi:type 1 glutamine amidotransferase family protein [Paenibacillus glufosinatiresistens]|uniref:type 1 glutamine amidotransferase family protein n=1 Tax=Paenibacillus glufosinatiresistens TaxID=3070657 RepID=UPI00286DC765|nr:type 1 glutamine amidotransferase family protein [Paenibacillus sp. YX.27]
MNRTVYLYVLDTMSDWEVGYLTAELNSGRYFRPALAPIKIVTVGVDRTPITTMGGLKIVPDINVDECAIKGIGALVLPGGNTWLEAVHAPILQIAERCLKEGVAVGAICGATLGLAQAGMLDSRWHTSNDLSYLKMICPSYSGQEYYKAEAAVTDGKLITAAGVAPLEFSVHVLKALDVFSPKTLDAWYSLNKTHKPEFFYELMNSIQ